MRHWGPTYGVKARRQSIRESAIQSGFGVALWKSRFDRSQSQGVSLRELADESGFGVRLKESANESGIGVSLKGVKVRGQLLRESAVASGFRIRLRGPDWEVIVGV